MIVDEEEEEEKEHHKEYKRIRIDDYLDYNEIKYIKKEKVENIWYMQEDEFKIAEEFETPHPQDLEKMELKANPELKFENQDGVLEYLRSILAPKRRFVKDPLPDPFN